MSDQYKTLWDEQIETLPSDRLQETIEQPRLLERLRWAFERSPFWRDKFLRAGLSLRDVKNGFPITALPFTEKDELLQDQIQHPPYGWLCSVPMTDILRVHRTSGTTARPLFIVLTALDVQHTLEAGARAFWCAGVRPDDTVVHCLNYCLWSGGLTDHLSLEKTGATVIPFGVGNSRFLLETMLQLKPTAISCTPTYLNTLAELLDKEFQRKPRELGLRKGLFGGEPGLQNPGTRTVLENTWGIEAVDANYGMSDVLSIFGSECRERNGLHFHGQGIVWSELIHPDTGESIPIRSGAVGELVLTTLLREGQPLFRLRTHDIAKIVGADGCRCGRSGFRFLILGRSDNMITVKGVNVFPDALHDIFFRYPEQLTGEYRMVLKHEGPYDLLDVQVEARASCADRERETLKHEMEGIVRRTLSVRIEIEWVGERTFPRGEGKTSRLVRAFRSQP
jgi:phenylacetate-CoA ligase